MPYHQFIILVYILGLYLLSLVTTPGTIFVGFFGLLVVLTVIVNEFEGNILNLSKYTVSQRLNLGTQSLLLQIIKAPTSEVFFSRGDLDSQKYFYVKYQKQEFKIYKSGEVYLTKKSGKEINERILQLGYGIYLYNWLGNNIRELEVTKNIINQIDSNFYSNNVTLNKLERDIRRALSDTEKINKYVLEINKIRKGYEKKFIDLHLN